MKLLKGRTMGQATDYKILKNHLSNGELKKVGQIASKTQYTETEVKFILSMAARSIKRLTPSLLNLCIFEIKDEGINYLISGK